MKGKILFVTGLGVGYVLGARAGRERYQLIKKTALKFWNDPRVQQQVDTAEAFVKDKAPDVAEFVADGAKKVVAQVTGTTKPATRRSTRKSTGSSSTGSSSAAKS
ncbi:MAG: YtxH domain-containing protein [Acidobacteria bacterium]|nr:YtxH domain-containing protein [Acidobacteriota bacterium]